ncbi:hypothetical protein [Halovivax sp.]|uniref:hypothetical protein n=1 Tax=Halovivax sp. TaxID=1935978 RepID=UPI0025BB05B1|nr:hypothetical protein [Halovivax sp.]
MLLLAPAIDHVPGWLPARPGEAYSQHAVTTVLAFSLIGIGATLVLVSRRAER